MSKNKPVRAFLALDVPAEVRSSIAGFQHKAKELLGPVKASWVKSDNIHLTLKFLGEIDRDSVRRIVSSLEPEGGVFTLTLEECGFFPGPRRPKVFWAGYEHSPSLMLLAKGIENQLQALGFPAENRPFKAHLTLARFRENKKLEEGTVNRILELSGKLRASHLIDHVTLYESTLTSSGSIYEPLHVFPIEGRT